MKLIDKKTIQSDKTLERKREIDEGLKLARRIDALRQKYSEEESNLRKFQDATLKELHEKVDNLSQQKQKLEKDVAELREQKKKLLDIKDLNWKEIDDKKEYLDNAELAFRDRVESLKQKELDIENRLLELSLDEERARNEREHASLNRKETEQARIQATQTLEMARNKEQEILKNLEAKTQTLLLREKDIASKERDNKLVADRQIMREQELDDREREINDKYETLLRTIKRLK